MRLLFFIALTAFIIWGWPYMFQKPAIDSPSTQSIREFTDVERQYYRQVFDYVMETVKPNSFYNWETENGRGRIYVNAPFKSPSSSTCRNFTEEYTIRNVNGATEGVACKRERRSGWCRLKRTDAMTCAMESPGNMVEKTIRSTDDAIAVGKDILGKIKKPW